MKNNRGFAPVIIILAILAILIAGGAVYYAMRNPNSASQNMQPQGDQNNVSNNSNTTTPGNLVGGDKDAHGCIGSAGYTWCAVKNKCLRVWKEKCEATPATTTTQNININGITITIPSNWKLRNPIDPGCRSINCSSSAAADGTSSYKIYNPSITTGTKTSDIDAVYITVGDCNSGLACPANSGIQLQLNTRSIYTRGLTIQTYGNNEEALNVYSSIVDQLPISATLTLPEPYITA